MTELEENSIDYFLIKELSNQVSNAKDERLIEAFKESKLCYLDDNQETLQEYISIIKELNEAAKSIAPSNLKSELEDMEEEEIRDVLKEHDILLYGRSGMRLNCRKLRELVE